MKKKLMKELMLKIMENYSPDEQAIIIKYNLDVVMTLLSYSAIMGVLEKSKLVEKPKKATAEMIRKKTYKKQTEE